MENLHPRGRYFEDFVAGERFVTPGRTVSEADILAFAGLSGDFNSIHTDAVYAATTLYGQRIAHGTLVLAMAIGLTTRSGVMEGTVLAFREMSDWKFSQPVFINDTIYARLTVSELRAVPRLRGGLVTLSVEILKHPEVVAQHGAWRVLMMSRP